MHNGIQFLYILFYDHFSCADVQCANFKRPTNTLLFYYNINIEYYDFVKIRVNNNLKCKSYHFCSVHINFAACSKFDMLISLQC